MADVLNRTTLEFRRSVNTPDFPVESWVIDPDISPVVGVASKHWKLTGDMVSEMTQGEKDAVDATEAAAILAAAKADAGTAIDGLRGYQLRALAKLLLDELNVLRQWIATFKAQTALASNLADFKTRIAALPNTPDRTLAQAKTAYKSAISGTGLDE